MPDFRSIEKFRSAVQHMSGLPTWKIVEALDRQGFWSQEQMAGVLMQYKMDYVRKMFGRVTNDDGNRLFMNIEISDSRGKRSRVYKSRESMTVEEYRQAVKAYCQRGAKGFAVARSLVKDCKQIHQVQLRLPFAA